MYNNNKIKKKNMDKNNKNTMSPKKFYELYSIMKYNSQAKQYCYVNLSTYNSPNNI